MKKLIKYIITIVLITIIPTTTFASSANSIGTSSDPYVTKSYVDVQITSKSKEIQDLKNQITELKKEIEQLKTSNTNGNTSSPTPTKPITPIVSVQKGYINGYYVNVRSSANVKSSIVATLQKNVSVEILKKVSTADSKYRNWYNIKLANGRTGYVYALYIRQ